MRILGIDPGSAIMGFGVIDSTAGQLTHVAHGTLRPPRSLKVAERLSFLHEGIRAVIRDHQPDAAAVEQVFVSGLADGATLLTFGQAFVDAGDPVRVSPEPAS